jgi:hypothetical protein
MLKLDENEWSADDGCKYQFRRQEDFFTINFFTHEKLKELAQIKTSTRKRNLINEIKSLNV